MKEFYFKFYIYSLGIFHAEILTLTSSLYTLYFKKIKIIFTNLIFIHKLYHVLKAFWISNKVTPYKKYLNFL